MSYCRWNAESDIYLFEHVDRTLTCFACFLSESRHFKTRSRAEMIEHLHKHADAGHLVPAHPLERLHKELETVGDKVQ